MHASVYCLVPESLADELLEPLRDHYRLDPTVEVIVDRRKEQRAAYGPDRRRPTMPRDFAASLPPALAARAGEVRWEQRLRPVRRRLQDATPERLLRLIADGDNVAYSEVYWRYAQRVRARLPRRPTEPRALEAAMKQSFGHLMDELGRAAQGGHAFETLIGVAADTVADAHAASVAQDGPAPAPRASDAG